MSDYPISQIHFTDRPSLAKVDALLMREGLRRDANLDYTCAMFDGRGDVIATGSCFGNTLRCLAVHGSHQGEGLLNEILTHLMEVQYERGNIRLFLYTKINAAKFFEDLGFYEIARVEDTLVFMENRKNGFEDYLKNLVRETDDALRSQTLRPAVGAASDAHGLSPAAGAAHFGKAAEKPAALVMNANPFTLGHQYLVETAAARCSILHLFIVSEDASLFPFSVRKKLVLAGVAHLPNVICHDSGPYIISSATFPSYFLKDQETVIKSQARLDLAVFTRIAGALSVASRFAGEEPYSRVTGIYNQIMAQNLPAAGIDCIIVPRKEAKGCPISGSKVRQHLKEKDFGALSGLVPASTLDYLKSDAAAPVMERICSAEDVAHY